MTVEYGFFVGRMNPIHLGHEAVIDHMIETCGLENSTIILGSANAAPSMRHFFSYVERRNFIRTLYPDIRILGIPDFPRDEDWVMALADIAESIIGKENVNSARFFGGSDYDVRLYVSAKHSVKIIDRFSGATPVISATEVRDRLLHKESLDGLLNPKISPDVQKLFHEHWEEFKQA